MDKENTSQILKNWSEANELIFCENKRYKEEVRLNADYIIQVLQYLPIQEKSKFVQYVVNSAIDTTTGCFSPIRVNVYFTIGILHFYCGIQFDEGQDLLEVYDLFEETGIINSILEAIPEEERNYMEKLVTDTIEDVTRYNNSFVGMVNSMSGDAENLDASLKNIMDKIKSKENLEYLEEIKNAVKKG